MPLRRVGILGAVAAMLVSSAALAAPGTRSYEGQVTQGFDSRLSFDVVKRESGKRKVKRVEFEEVPAFCAGDSGSAISGSVRGSAKVRKRKFKLNRSGPLQMLSVKGKITQRSRKVSGSLSFSGSFDIEGQTLSCATGPRGWTAERT